MDAKSDRGETRSCPQRRLTLVLHNYYKDFEKYDSTSLKKELKKKNSIIRSSIRKPEKTTEKIIYYPSNLELIQKMKKFKSINEPLTTFTFDKNEKFCIIQTGYGKKSLTFNRKTNERKNFLEYELPEDPNELDLLLRTIKETERVIRQENEFIYKVRKFKPKIQLKLRTRSDSESSEGKMKGLSKRWNKTPVPLSRSGIQTLTFNQ
jgi:hypothetical protein